MDYSELLSKEVASAEDSLREQLSQMSKEQLVKWCHEHIDKHLTIVEMASKALDPERLIANSRLGSVLPRKDQKAALRLAKTDPGWCNSLIKAVKDLRENDANVPSEWRDYVLDVLLRVEKRPDGRGKASNSTRDSAILWCISKIERHTEFYATRAEESEKPCAASIVSEALKGKPKTESVKKIWVNRDKKEFPSSKS